MPYNKNEDSNKKISTLVLRYEFKFKDSIPDNEQKLELQKCYKHNKCILCKKLLELANTRVWTRTHIEDISEKLGYNVFENPGGFVDENGNPDCVCEWKSVVLKKIR